MERPQNGSPHVVDRYAIYDAIAAGGMATVHVGRLIGPIGFSRTVAIKRLHAQFAKDPEFCAMFLDEAKVASRIRHPNVVPVIDVVAHGGELLLVMEYVHGESLSFLLRAHAQPSPERTRVVTNVVAGALHGLHAAHETRGDGDKPLDIVHRDVSPQNVLLGLDGLPRVLDFGVAKAAGQAHSTGAGRVKGKLRYLAPELIKQEGLDRRADVWSAAVMLWEALTGQRLFTGERAMDVMSQVLNRPIPSPRAVVPDLPEPLCRAILRGLARDPAQRFATAVEMASALEDAVGLLGPREVGAWVARAARERLDARWRLIAEIEQRALAPDPAPPSSTALTMTSPAVTPGEPTMVQRAPGRRRAWLVPLGASAAVAVVAAAVAILGGDGARPSTAASGPVTGAPIAGTTVAGMTVASVSATTAPVTSAPAPSARGEREPVASATAAGVPTSAPSSSAPPPPSQRARARGGARAGSTAGQSAEFRVPLYGRD